EGVRGARAGLPVQPPHQGAERRRPGVGAGRDRGVPRPEPRDVAAAGVAPGARVGVREGPDRDLPGVQPGRPGAQWSLPTTCSAARIASPTGSPSGTTTGGPTTNPRSVRNSTSTGPVVSS